MVFAVRADAPWQVEQFHAILARFLESCVAMRTQSPILFGRVATTRTDLLFFDLLEKRFFFQSAFILFSKRLIRA